MMWTARSLLKRSTNAARVVVFPAPLGPETLGGESLFSPAWVGPHERLVGARAVSRVVPVGVRCEAVEPDQGAAPHGQRPEELARGDLLERLPP